MVQHSSCMSLYVLYVIVLLLQARPALYANILLYSCLWQYYDLWASSLICCVFLRMHMVLQLDATLAIHFTYRCMCVCSGTREHACLPCKQILVHVCCAVSNMCGVSRVWRCVEQRFAACLCRTGAHTRLVAEISMRASSHHH